MSTIKIGRVEKDNIDVLRRRIRNLSAPSGVPSKYVLACAVVVNDVKNKERLLHDIFLDAREDASPRSGKAKEFFKVDLERVKSAMELTGGKMIYGEDLEPKSGQQKNEKKPAFKFSMVGLDAGAELTFSEGEHIVAYVHSDSKVKFGGEIMSLSKAAEKAFEKIGEHKSSLRGPAHWKYRGEILNEMRERKGIEPKTKSIVGKKPGQQKNERKSPKSPFKFSKVGLEAGAKLTFSQDESIVAYVHDDSSDNKVYFEGESKSITSSKAAQEAFVRMGKPDKSKSQRCGPDYWKYKGETLNEMRERISPEE